MKELQDLVDFLKNKGLGEQKIDIDVLCGIAEYFTKTPKLDKIVQAQILKNQLVIMNALSPEVISRLSFDDLLGEIISGIGATQILIQEIDKK